MSVLPSRIQVGTSATLLVSASVTGTGSLSDGVSVLITNKDETAEMDIGGSDVTTGTGYALEAGRSITMDLDPDESVYGVVATGTVMAHVLRNRAP